jgi:hypothetical protein
MPWQKGNSGNPKGRPRVTESIAALLRAELARPYHGTQTYKERIAAVVVAQAAKGNLAALAWLVDRTEGKVTDKVEQSGTTTTRIQVDYGDGDVRADD